MNASKATWGTQQPSCGQKRIEGLIWVHSSVSCTASPQVEDSRQLPLLWPPHGLLVHSSVSSHAWCGSSSVVLMPLPQGTHGVELLASASYNPALQFKHNDAATPEYCPG